MENVANEDDNEKEEDEHPLKVSRRLIYLHRLVGDNVLEPKTRTSRPNPWRVTFVFLFYAICATITNLSFTDVGLLSSSNIHLKKTLHEATWGKDGDRVKNYQDINRAPDVLKYIQFGIMPRLMMASNMSEANSMLSYNKVLAHDGFCENVSVLILTMRKMKTTNNFKETTTDRFNVLYPETWVKDTITGGAATGDYEDTQTLWGSYVYPGMTVQQPEPPAANPPEDKLGFYGNNRSNMKKMTYRKLNGSFDRTVFVKWDHTPAAPESKEVYNGYNGAGGYVAAVTILNSKAIKAKLDAMFQATGAVDWPALAEVARDQFVYLLSPTASAVPGDSLQCGDRGIKATNVMRFVDFEQAGFVDDRTASIVLDMMVYNANKQTMSEIIQSWSVHSSGVIEYPNPMLVRTIKLDLDESYYPVWEMIYIIGTLFYFLELFLYKGCFKYRLKLFRDIWSYVNAISIICSCMSLVFRQQYAGSNKENMNLSSGPEHIKTRDDLFRQDMVTSNVFQWTSALALLTIWLRVVELLAQTPPRVKLLNATLIKALGSMGIYFGYIFVIIVGFWAFASVHFCAVSIDFLEPFPQAFISVFSLFCLNTLPYYTTEGAPLRLAFFIPYMLFAIISVQMFNSIINYAYNKVSEDMEPIFKRAAMERKHKDKQKGYLERICSLIKDCCKKCKQTLKISQSQKEDKDKGATEDKPPADIIITDDLQAADKEKVEAFNESLQKKQAPETALSFMLYMIFAASYMAFMWMSLDVATNGAAFRAVNEAIYNAKARLEHPYGKPGYFTANEITNIPNMARWMTEALPRLMSPYEQYAHPEDEGMGAGLVCLHHWNCLVYGSDESFGASIKGVRVTQKLQKRVPNEGQIQMDGKLAEERFIGGASIIPTRGPAKPLGAASEGSDEEDTATDYTLYFDGVPFCVRQPKGGFRSAGGIVCLLDSDFTNMTLQLETMSTNDFYTMATGTVTVDMVFFNGNANVVIYVILTFVVQPSGAVLLNDETEAFSLLTMDEEAPDAGMRDKIVNWLRNAVRFEYICGLIYAVLTVQFIVRLVNDLKAEAHRKKLNDNTTFAVAFYEFFAKDLFHTLDLISYIFSIMSIVFFSLWLNQQMQLGVKVNGNFSELLTYIGHIQNNARMYTLISAANLLIICVRPLKYLRGDPRMKRINETFMSSTEDVAWFIVMLLFFFVGFVIFSHLVFGITIENYSGIDTAAVSCFSFLLGQYDFWALAEVNAGLAAFFVFGFLFLFKFFFLNVFFAIIDKNFVSGDPPPLNLRRTFKPVLGRLIRFIEWDEDYTMGGNAKSDITDRPPSRAGRVHEVAVKIQRLQREEGDGGGDEDGNLGMRQCQTLNDVCDVDEKMNEVLRWSRDEAKRFVELYRKRQADKQEFRNDEAFLKKIKGEIDKDHEDIKKAMLNSERHQRYAIYVNEQMGKTDQDTLSKYILRLEDKITQKMKEKHALLTDVYHLRAEAEKMRYTDEDMKRIADEEVLEHEKALEVEEAAGGKDDESSEGEYAQPVEVIGKSRLPGTIPKESRQAIAV